MYIWRLCLNHRLFVAATFAAVFEELSGFFRINAYFFQALSDGHVQIDFRQVAFASIFCFHGVLG